MEGDRNEEDRTVSRKQQHVDLCVGEDVRFRNKSAGFEAFEFRHNALPELDYSEISLSLDFLGRNISCPLMISSMTGGYRDAAGINARLAEVCESFRIPMGVGSQRQALESSVHHETFSIVREKAPNIPIISNIGAAELAKGVSQDSVRTIIDLVQADALAVHLNPLQELLQPEGTPNFRGVLKAIEELVRGCGVPVIAKEVGAGISASVAKRLLDAGVAAIDVAGAGGTSWAGVELLRTEERSGTEEFWDWGIPTAECIREIAPMKRQRSFMLIASGGIASGIDAAKSIALGADCASSARPFLKTLVEEGQERLEARISLWARQIRHIMFLTGSKNIPDLQKAELRITGNFAINPSL